MSGVYKPLIIGLGAVSSALCIWIVHRLGLLQDASIFSHVRVSGLLRYFAWLVVEIGKADWAVTKVILAGDMPIKQQLIKVPNSQKSDIGKTLFANSITITPGTITVETEGDHFLVHALTDEAADMAALSAMDGRVSSFEIQTTESS